MLNRKATVENEDGKSTNANEGYPSTSSLIEQAYAASTMGGMKPVAPTDEEVEQVEEQEEGEDVQLSAKLTLDSCNQTSHSDVESRPVESDKAIVREAEVWIHSLGNYPTDPAHFKGKEMTAEVRAEIVKHGPCQPRDIVFRKNSEDRSFHASWYRKNSNKRDWLVFSLKENKMYCFCCWLFPCKSSKDYEENWSVNRVDNFKKGLEKIKKYEDTNLHCTSLAAWKSFHRRLIRGQTIDNKIQAELNREREKTLLVLDRIFSVAMFLALQGISFRVIDMKAKKRCLTHCIIVENT
eukprot:gene66-662_t